MSGTGLPARRAALAALRAVEERGAYSNMAVPDAVGGLADARERAFASHLAYDTLRWTGTLDWALGHVVERALDAVEPDLLRILRLGALQLLRTEVPARAAVHTSVALACETVPAARAKGAGGFVNGVLRGLSRRRDELPWPDPETDPATHLALRTAHPTWIVAERLERLGFDETRALLEADNEPPGLTLRAVGDRDALVAELRAAGIDAQPGAIAPEAVRAPGADPRRIDAVAAGRAVPQDEASMVVAHACDVASSQRVFDVCAGPGGKASHLAQLAGRHGRVVASDVHPHRARLVADVAERCDVRVAVLVADGRRPPFRADFDVVLVDAPCSGLGTGRRRPEIRWRRSAEDVERLAVLQTHLLGAATGCVRPGGRLVYSACTWTEAETSRVARSVLEEHGELRLVSERQLLPHTDGTDGMYVAVLARA